MMFYEKLKECREQLSLSQEDIAKTLHVTRQAVSKWERGINEPDLETIVRLSDLYGVTIDTLLREDLSVVRKLAVKERSYRKLLIAVAVLGGVVLLMLLSISLQIKS
ncbi:MAG: helix-turn-helix domain-containing protein [Coriobacteriales bacterium]|jgi:transcriptional regulator with XRE-family HTH domain|nr:helix-turn-helix domain-containing protein [Coriobacteriales bacterium]